MKYLFILGRNEDLSIVEIEEYLKKENNTAQEITKTDNGFLVTVENPISQDTVNFLGGVISIGEVLAFGKDNEIISEMENITIYNGTSNKLTYTLWDFSEMTESIYSYLKKRFKSEKVKTSYKGLTGKIQTQGGAIKLKPSSKLLDVEYFIFQEKDKQYFGKITQKCDYNSIEKRDMEKPVRRESLAIAPRLAKILINLAGLKCGDILLDPFCGIGSILQEALLQDITAFGFDIDTEAINGAKKNMNWFNFKRTEYSINKGDSRYVELPEANAIVTEPDLGDILKKVPTKSNAERTLKDFENLMIDVINNSKEMISGRIVFTSPYIRLGKKRINCNIEKICEKTGYSLVRPGIPEFRGKQIVGRMIYILA